MIPAILLISLAGLYILGVCLMFVRRLRVVGFAAVAFAIAGGIVELTAFHQPGWSAVWFLTACSTLINTFSLRSADRWRTR